MTTSRSSTPSFPLDIAASATGTAIGASLIGAVISPLVGGFRVDWAPWIIVAGLAIAIVAAFVSHRSRRASHDHDTDRLHRIEEQTTATHADLTQLNQQILELKAHLDYRLK